jgi:hypothetical protein
MKDNMKSTRAEVPIPLGQTLITVRARETLHPQEVLSALWRHAHEPWGKCFDPNNETDANPLREERRLLSNHFSSRGQAFRIATEEAGTFVFLSEETDLSHTGLVDAWICNLACPNCG